MHSVSVHGEKPAIYNKDKEKISERKETFNDSGDEVGFTYREYSL